jgi:hypothetical protein
VATVITVVSLAVLAPVEAWFERRNAADDHQKKIL